MSHDEDYFSDCDPNHIRLKQTIDSETFGESRADACFIERLPQALSYAASLDVGDHAILFYDNLVVAAEYFCAYIEEGIKRNETTHFIGLPRDRYEKLFSQLGIRVAELENSGYLRQRELHSLFEDREPKENKVRRAIESFLRDGMEAGYRGKRFILINQWPLDESARRLVELENWLSNIPRPASVICSYDAREATSAENSDLFLKLLKVHGHCMFQGIGMPTNILLRDQLSAYPKLGTSPLR